MAKDAVFPSRALQRQLTSAQQRLRDMQDELEAMREQEAHERKRRKRKRYLVSVRAQQVGSLTLTNNSKLQYVHD